MKQKLSKMKITVSAFLSPHARGAEIRVPDDYSTIQSAIDGAIDGDVIIVKIGTYYENIKFKGKAITLRSTDPNDPIVVAATIIDGEGAGSVITFNNSEGINSALRGITLQNGNNPCGGGIYCNSSSPTIINCMIYDNTAENIGGGIY